MKFIKLIFLVAITFFIYGNSFSQNLSAPFISNYTSMDYKADVQNWSVVQDTTGYIYVGNSIGVLVYNGVDWKLIKNSNNSLIRSFAVHKSKNITFVGGVGDLGFLSMNELGKLSYYSLLQQLPDSIMEISDVWKTYCIGDRVFFQTFDFIVEFQIPDKLNNNNFKVKNVFSPRKKFHFSFVIGNTLYVRDWENGLFVLKNEKLHLIENSELFAQERIYSMERYSKSEIIIGTRTMGVLIFNEELNTFTKPNNFEEVDKFMNEHPFYEGILLSGNTFLYATLGGGILEFDKTGKIINRINRNRGLNEDIVWAVFEDRHQSIWVATDNGISHIELNSGFETVNPIFDFESGINTLQKQNDIFYYGLMSNLVYQKDNKFGIIEGLSNGVGIWQMLEVKADSIFENDFILLCSDNVYKVEGLKAEPIIKAIPGDAIFNVYRSKFYPRRFFVSNYDGVRSFFYKNNQWVNEGVIKGVSSEIRIVSEDKFGNVWIASAFDGIYKVENLVNNKGTKNEEYNVTHYGEAENMKASGFPSIATYNSELLFCTDKGSFIFDDNKKQFIHADIFEDSKFKDKYVIIKGLNNEETIIYEVNKKKHYFAKKNKSGKLVCDNIFFNRIPETELYTESGILVDQNKTIWMGGSSGLFSANQSNLKNISSNFNTVIASCKTAKDSIIYYGNRGVPTIVEKGNSNDNEYRNILSYKNNSVIFSFATLSFDDGKNNLFSYKLEGFDEDWATWSNKTEKEYTNLTEGKYTFLVKSKNVYGVVGTTSEFSFEIDPPIYRTVTAYIIYAFFFVLFVWAFARLNSNRLLKQKEELEKIVVMRTSEISEQKDEILVQNEQLTHQKEEIISQKEELENINIELEKLSIVASETDNAIIITDAKGRFEWINDGCTRLYGYTFKEFINIGVDILSFSSNPNMNRILNECFSTKKSVKYETEVKTKSNKKIWIQSTYTPIFDKSGQIIKLIIIGSDITAMKSAQKEILKKNEMIHHSISYAKTIQSAMLPSEAIISSFFSSFIIYKPKDIVSGDFYWAVRLKNAEKNAIIVAAVDCTGHGVPGAFMSMIGMSILNNIVKVNRIYEPARIINKLNTEIIRALRQKSTNNQDGMDMGLIYAEEADNDKINIQYAGAKRPLIIYRNSDKTTENIKGSRRSVGGTKMINATRKVSYEETKVTLLKGDVIYMFSDGYPDQNNNKRKRFGTPTLINIISEIGTQSTDVQKQILEDKLRAWQKNEKQRDDILLMGLKFE